MLAKRAPLDALDGSSSPRRLWRWLAFALVLIALASLGWLLFSSLQVSRPLAQARGLADPFPAVIAAAAVTGAGLVSLVWLLMTASNRARRLAQLPVEWTGDTSTATGFGWNRSSASAAATDAETGLPAPAIATTTAGTNHAARALENRLRTMRDLGRVGYWQHDDSGRYLRVEPAHHESQLRLTALTGQTRASLAANAAAGVAIAGLQSRVDARQAFHQILWRCRLPAGPVLTLRESGMPQFGENGRFIGYQGTIEEVTDVVLDPVRNHRVTQALSALTIPIMLLHRHLRDEASGGWKLVWANAALSNLTGRNEVELGQIDPQRWLLCAPSPGAAELAPDNRGSLLARLLHAGQTHQGPGLVMDRYGARRPVQITLERIDDEGDAQLALAVADPVAAEFASLRDEAAEVRQAQRNEGKRALEMELMRRELESFSHTVSHDLRHPVRVVDGFARMLQDDYGHLLDRSGVEHVNRILAASHRMNSMMDALIDLHRISAQPVESYPVDLSALATAIVDELRESEPQRQVDVVIEPHLACRGDRILLRMALFNLLENAWKYTSRTQDARIEFDAVPLYDTLVYRVCDNGAGFDMRYADRLFDLFHRLHGQADFKGTGVGLATVQRAIRRHGGRIWAESAPGEGARFQFTLWDDNTVTAADRGQ